MLFSRDDVASHINKHFESAWESVRPVPVVRIDFGNGTVVTRTLHGNIATYICNAGGNVLDVLPGIYEPTVYLDRLNRFRLLASYVQAHSSETRAVFVKEYHQRLAAAPAPAPIKRLDLSKSIAVENPLEVLVRNGGANTVVVEPMPNPTPRPDPAPSSALKIRLDVTKIDGVEKPVETVVREAASNGTIVAPAAPVKWQAEQAPPEDLASWKLLHEDTRMNEVVRRRQIHALLSDTGLVRPEAVSKRIYKDILHADLGDPYLGLGPTLFGSYPFRNEDTR